ncbi:MAG TPA: hypothetical protein PLQ35_04620 [bacterium]|nr:hypothetical protein [bacterium]HQL61557.1 hypothetical protein [bacterium]
MTFISTLIALVQSLGSVLLPVLLGILFGRFSQRMEDRTVAICLLFFFLPVYLLFNLARPMQVDKDLGLVLFFFFFHTAALWIVSSFVLRMFHLSQKAHSLILMTILLAHPFLIPPQMLSPLTGETGIATETAANIYHVALVIVAVLGMYLGSQKMSFPERLFEMLTVPVACFGLLGFALGLLRVGLAETIPKILSPSAQAAMPLTFLLLGFLIGRGLHLFELLSSAQILFAAGIATALKLVLSPIIGVLLVHIMPIGPALGNLLILQTAMPTAAIACVFTAYYGQPPDRRYVALCIVLSSLICCVTIPILCKFLV